MDAEAVLKMYRGNIRTSFELYMFNLFMFSTVAGFANEDAERKHAKLLPSEEDKRFTPKLCENPLLISITKNAELQRFFSAYKFESKIDPDIVRRFYIEFAKGDEYKAYMLQEQSTIQDHKKVLLDLYKNCIQNEAFNEYLEDFYPLWFDDKSLVVGAMKKTVKALPAEEDFYKEYEPSDDTIKDFGETLLLKVINSDGELLEMIEPTLKNWDADRVAVIDMILIKMALGELLSFPTIPTKVTLNEFVEISKMYSTEKSKDFINGILDRLMKKLNKDGKINKEGRGLVE
ncbi:MAG: N utilization substance protein B [Saprospiraceae bacterium]|nr:MAG: N utilization substance protein B [Saprospiraceae bacterium]